MNILRYAFKNIFRNFFLSASSILIITLLIFFVNILLLVVFSANKFIASVSDRISITINLQPGYDNTQVRSTQFLSGIVTNFPGTVVDYISKDQAFTILQTRNPDLASLVEHTDENPLPNSIRISNVAIGSYDALNTYISTYKDILQYDQGDMTKKLVDYKSQYERVSMVADMLRILRTAVYILIGLFLFTVFVVVHMVIRNFMFFLQDEVRIIELVGGRPSFIYGPFVVQGLFYTIFSTALALGVFLIARMVTTSQAIPDTIGTLMGEFYTLLFDHYAILEFALFGAIGVVSALLASYKYIHSTIGE